jgi:hypothetical protein
MKNSNILRVISWEILKQKLFSPTILWKLFLLIQFSLECDKTSKLRLPFSEEKAPTELLHMLYDYE